MEKNQISALLVSYIGMNELNDLCNSVNTNVTNFLALQEAGDANLLAFNNILGQQNSQFTQALNLERKLNDTKKVQLCDKLRDSYSTTFYGLVKVHVNSPIEEMAQAANRVYQILKNNGGNPARASAEKQSSVMASVFNDIDAEHLDDIEILSLSTLYTGMVEAQNDYKEAELARNNDKVQKQNSESASVVQKRVMSAYTDVIDFLNLMVRISPDVYTSVVDSIDALVTSINTKAKARNSNAKKPEQV